MVDKGKFVVGRIGIYSHLAKPGNQNKDKAKQYIKWQFVSSKIAF
jgi:hypothetical protein